MNIKLITILGVVIIAAWYSYVSGRKVDEAHIRTLYMTYLNAFDNGDGKAACELFDDKVTGHFYSTSRFVNVDENITKAAACAAVDDLYKKKRDIEAAIGEKMYTNFECTIKSIVISPDERTATVQLLMVTRIGTEKKAYLDMRSEQTDIIVRNFGKTKILETNGSVSFYQ